MLLHRDNFEGYVATEDISFGDYINDMRKRKEWGDELELELIAASQLYMFNFHYVWLDKIDLW